jgi:hypothetical protein
VRKSCTPAVIGPASFPANPIRSSLVFLNAVNQMVLFAAALTATSTAGRPADLVS